MPMVKRAIEPSDISRSRLDSDVKNELECVANNSLAFIIQQLSSLSKHSEDLFGELYAETSSIATRTNNLCIRIENLKLKIVQLNPTVEEVLLQEINLRKPFKSPAYRDQQIMVRSTRPYCVNEAYMNCEAPPSLSELDMFREDGKSSLKFYTDPNYFVELWYSEMKAAQNQQKKPRHKHGQVHKASSKPKALRTPKNKIEEFKDFRHGPEFVDNFRRQHSITGNIASNGVTSKVTNQASELKGNSPQRSVLAASDFSDGIGHPTKQANPEEINCPPTTKSSSLGHMASPRPVGPPPEPPKKLSHVPPRAGQHFGSSNHFSQNSIIHSQLAEMDGAMQARFSPTSNYQHYEGAFNGDNSLPPPPPSPHRLEAGSPTQCQLPSPPKMTSSANDLELSPLPPPPPLSEPLFDEMFLPQALVQAAKDQPTFDGEEHVAVDCDKKEPQPDAESLASNSSSNTCSTAATDALKSSHPADKGPLIRDTRSDLLSAIREGIQLRKVEEHRLKSEQNKKVGPLDVQSIMEAAFEMRRKALEDNDSEDAEEDEANWSD